MNSLKNISKATGVAALVAYGSSATAAIPPGTAVADSFLSVSNFTILEGDGGYGKGTSLLPLLVGGELFLDLGDFGDDGIPGTSDDNPGDVSSTGDTSANLIPIAGVDAEATNVGAAQAFNLNSFQGAGSFDAGVSNLGGFGSTYGDDSYVAGHSSTYGNALDLSPNNSSPADLGLTPNGDLEQAFPPPGQFIGNDEWPAGADCGDNVGDCVHVQSQVNLVGTNSGTGTSNQGLGLNFSLGVGVDPDSGQIGPVPPTTDGRRLEISFDADGFLRTALGQDNDLAQASHSWMFTLEGLAVGADGIFGTADDEEFLVIWNPGASLTCDLGGGAGDCEEEAALFNLNRNISIENDGLPFLGDRVVDNIADNPDGDEENEFELEVFVPAGFYDFTITHNTFVDAQLTVVPEPGTLALISAGLLGFGASRRRLKKSV